MPEARLIRRGTLELELVGVTLFLLGMFGRHISPTLARYRSYLLIGGAAIFLLGFIPKFMDKFFEAYKIGKEMRR